MIGLKWNQSTIFIEQFILQILVVLYFKHDHILLWAGSSMFNANNETLGHRNGIV